MEPSSVILLDGVRIEKGVVVGVVTHDVPDNAKSAKEVPARVVNMCNQACGGDTSRVQMCHFELRTRGQGDKGERKLLLRMQLGVRWNRRDRLNHYL